MSKNSRMLESIPHTGLKHATHIDVEVYYTKGGPNLWSGGYTQRGYYISAKPVTRNGVSISYTMFTGTSKLLMEASRFSEKQLEQAVELGRAEASGLIAMVLAQNKAA